MTNEEIEKQAEEYAVENWEHCVEGQTDYTAINKAFKAGAKWGMEHAIEWHDLREDSKDLPKKYGRYWGYVDYYGLQHREILWENNQFDVTGVIAWRELPKFKE